jgi:predicted tellurium resistance membrane protein TerC
MDILSLDGLIALFTLTLLEVVLGIDNIIFISIITNKLPKENQKKARNIGLLLALIFRVALLLGITWIMSLTNPIIDVEIYKWALKLSGKDLILLFGGLFLIGKSTHEIHSKIDKDNHHEEENKSSKPVSISKIIIQIILLDLVFSFDSILTAVGLTQTVGIMILAVIISMIIMMLFAGKISDFINKRPTLQILALSFLILIGFMLMIEAFHFEVPKGYIYFAVIYALIVELINSKVRTK